MRADILFQLARIRLTSVVAAIGFGLGAGAVSVAYVSPRSPITNVTVTGVDGVAIRGRWVDIAFKFDRSFECDARVERWFWRYMPDGRKRWVQLDATGSNPPTGLGLNVAYVLTLPLPPAVNGGQWYYQSRSYDLCGWQTLLRGPNVRISGDVSVFIFEEQKS